VHSPCAAEASWRTDILNQQPSYTIRKRHRNWMVIDPQGRLVCRTV
jgi:hypothetical protein